MKLPWKAVILILFLATSFILNAQTIIPGGYVSGAWDSAGSPYLVDGNLLVQPDSTLAIGPGTEILFRGDFRLEVPGQLLINGTPSQPVLFDGQDETITWRGIYLNNTDTSITDSSILAHGTIRNCLGGSGLTLVNSDRVRISFFTIDQCSSFQGGAIRCVGSDAWFENLIIENNIALDGAGMALDHSGAIMKNCIIRNNQADGAGGGMVIFNGSSPVLENCEISGNFSYGSGGGIYINAAGTVCIRCSFTTNYGATGGGSLYSGGAVAVKLAANPHFENCFFIENQCNSSGGAIASFSPNSLINCLFEENSAPVSGGAVYISSGNPIETRLINNTFINNDSPDGSVLYAHNHVAIVKNCIAWQDETPDTSSLFCLDAFMALEALDVSWSDLKNGQEGIELTGNASFHWGPGNISSDPLLNPESFEPAWNSPCIEAGTPDTTGLVLPELDLAGNPRLVNDVIDMGAFEFQNPLTIQHSTLNIQHYLTIIPNPAHHQVSISYSDIFGSEKKEIIIYNSLGIPVKSIVATDEVSGISTDISELPDGLYFVVLMVNGRITATGKLVVRY